jgi:hypothetical protein
MQTPMMMMMGSKSLTDFVTVILIFCVLGNISAQRDKLPLVFDLEGRLASSAVPANSHYRRASDSFVSEVLDNAVRR